MISKIHQLQVFRENMITVINFYHCFVNVHILNRRPMETPICGLTPKWVFFVQKKCYTKFQESCIWRHWYRKCPQRSYHNRYKTRLILVLRYIFRAQNKGWNLRWKVTALSNWYTIEIRWSWKWRKDQDSFLLQNVISLKNIHGETFDDFITVIYFQIFEPSVVARSE